MVGIPPSRMVPSYPRLGSVLSSVAGAAYPSSAPAKDTMMHGPVGFSVSPELPFPKRMVPRVRNRGLLSQGRCREVFLLVVTSRKSSFYLLARLTTLCLVLFQDIGDCLHFPDEMVISIACLLGLYAHGLYFLEKSRKGLPKPCSILCSSDTREKNTREISEVRCRMGR